MAKRGGPRSMGRPVVECLPIDSINVMDGWEKDIEAGRITWLKNSIKKAGLLYPVLIWRADPWSPPWLLDGLHRLHATRELGFRNIVVREIIAKDWQEAADIVNTVHYQPRSQTDGKRSQARSKPRGSDAPNGLSRGGKNRGAGQPRKRRVQAQDTGFRRQPRVADTAHGAGQTAKHRHHEL